MGIKRRAMFNPKFRNSRTRRWNLGRKMLGIPTEQELEAERLSATAERVEKARLAEAETARLKAEEKVKMQLAAEAKFKAEQEAKSARTRATNTNKPRTRKTRARKATSATKND